VSFVDGLQRANLILRERDERDRRRQIMTRTAAGRRVLREVEDRLDAAEPGVLAVLTAAERAGLHEYAARALAAAMPGAWSGDAGRESAATVRTTG
jgi:MarR family transcriptional regulator, lower aerobic nicotinate degradation pathway regulator